MELAKISWRLAGAALVALCLHVEPASAEVPPESQKPPLALRNNVVALKAVWEDGTVKDGFGFMVGMRDGTTYIVTANHIVRGLDPGQIARKISVRVRDRPGEEINGELIGISDQTIDIAIITTRLPAELRWRRDILAPAVTIADLKTPVWFIGRDGTWFVPEQPGSIEQVVPSTGRIATTGLDVGVGTSGAPLVSEGGLVGMIVDDSGTTQSAISISAIKEVFTKWPELPWQLIVVEPLAHFSDCEMCPEMIVIPGGSFMMGSLDSSGRDAIERPQHEVAVSSFAAGKFEITFDEWGACVADAGCAGYHPDDMGWGREKRPVIHVSWTDAGLYVSWLRGKTGLNYRLLSEAEWEYAARAGTSTRNYWGDGVGEICEFANISDQSTMQHWASIDSELAKLIRSLNEYTANCADGFGVTSPVGSLKPNGFGLHDVMGNAREWVEDCWHQSYDGAPADGSAWNDGDCAEHVLRGRSWGSTAERISSSRRDMGSTGLREFIYGFRVARDLVP